jgi:hypothetical protein
MECAGDTGQQHHHNIMSDNIKILVIRALEPHPLRLQSRYLSLLP